MKNQIGKSAMWFHLRELSATIIKMRLCVAPSFRENKYGRKLQKVAENSVELKRIVFALFSQNEKSATRISFKLLIFSVDQVGLEPTTSRL